MSGLLLQPTIDYLRGELTIAQAKTVDAYGGEFTAAENDQVSFMAPAVFISVLGWQPETGNKYLTGRNVRRVRMAAFVVTKAAKRTERLAKAMALAELVASKLRGWQPQVLHELPLHMAPLEEEPQAENMYGRQVDAAAQALWMVSWDQCVKPLATPEVTYDLLAVEIVDTTRQGVVPAPAAPPGTLTVTQEVNFTSPLPLATP